jgi:pantothenate kinase type III
MRFLIDVGNTRLKWARLVDGKLTHLGSATHRDSLDRALASLSARCRRARARRERGGR